MNLGDRLVYSNGILVLAGVASVLIWVFHADVLSLIHLYVIGVFTAFTLSQSGMVRHWWRLREPGWQRKAAVNGLGAVVTGVVTLLVIQTKFGEGAWMVTVAIPLLVVLFYLVHRHYRLVARRFRAGAAAVRWRRWPATPSSCTSTGWIRRPSWRPGTRSRSAAARSMPSVPRDRAAAVDSGIPVTPLSGEESPADGVFDYVWALPRAEQGF